MKLKKGKIYKVECVRGYIRAVYMGVMKGEMTICDVNVKGGRLHYITKEDIDRGHVKKDNEDYHLK
jgi:hypothetical protein